MYVYILSSEKPYILHSSNNTHNTPLAPLFQFSHVLIYNNKIFHFMKKKKWLILHPFRITVCPSATCVPSLTLYVQNDGQMHGT